jgi:hypothetical protein
MIRRTRRGDVITSRHAHSTKPWFHFPRGDALGLATTGDYRTVFQCHARIYGESMGNLLRCRPVAVHEALNVCQRDLMNGYQLD